MMFQWTSGFLFYLVILLLMTDCFSVSTVRSVLFLKILSSPLSADEVYLEITLPLAPLTALLEPFSLFDYFF